MVILKIFTYIDPICLAEEHHEYWLIASFQYFFYKQFSIETSAKNRNFNISGTRSHATPQI